MKRDRILFISNGYGEDTIATGIIKKLTEMTGKGVIFSFPLVGQGTAYSKIGVDVIAPTLDMPSGGLIPGGYVKNLWKDINSGLVGLTFRQIGALSKAGSNTALIVAVGDLYPVLLAGLFGSTPVIFVGTAKSDYFYPYSVMEMGLLKQFCREVFPRDEITAESLRKSGINARWLGNAMMDDLEFSGQRFGIPGEQTVITLLPGSRDFAYADFPVILAGIRILSQKSGGPLSFVAPLANSTTVKELGECSAVAGFEYEETGADRGVVGRIFTDTIEILLLRGYFGSALQMARLVIGQAGTGNEQAVGLGKPVVAFDSDGNEKMGWYRLRQKGLLGDSLAVVSRDAEAIAEKSLQILQDKSEYERMARIGIQRMGPAGGAGKMADAIYDSYMKIKNGSISENE